MALTKITDKKLYLALSSDVAENKIAGAGNIGWDVLITDTNRHYIIAPDLTLIEAATNAVSLSSGESFLGSVGSNSNVLDYTLVLDTSPYGIGDVLAITAEVGSFFRVNGGTASIIGVRLLDEDKQSGDLDILLFNSMVNIGTINSPYDLTDIEARSLIGRFVFTASDYTTWTNFSDAYLVMNNPGFKAGILKGASDSRSIWIAAISRSTKTYSAGGLKLHIEYFND
jgi:hypothetical protein